MSDFAGIVDDYLAVWNEPDADARAVRIAEMFAAEAAYTDPMAAVTGHEGISALIGGARAQFPGMVFSSGGTVDAHHDIARFTWHLAPPGAVEPLVVGFDVIRVDGAGRIADVLGFLDRVPQA
ncbi:nuclear transport factor 2 family protein [Actinoplanes sp. NEAU-A12]|uniref:Nuclear transport factor 2 family protein n=1 Tax=Actinoplanes sandaracinus TaxID=3045177 RepID=A0ABT6WX97_9ACTN|nr:nuclear transport factor 2 family protein [Actinoplanes sandaracinus]MDI6104255.1 nuclear transport factor 2 family protein [Actinoplanes sandaracinus]